MTSQGSLRLALGVLALHLFVAASSARAPQHSAPHAEGGPSHLVAFGSRAPAQWRSARLSKLDGALSDLARHADRVRTGHALEDLHDLSPAAKFAAGRVGSEPLVLVDAVTRGDARRLRDVLVGLGLQHPSVYLNDVSGWLPVRQIEAATARAELLSLRAAMPHTRAGAVTSQGDFAQASAAARLAWSQFDGRGVTVGILSDSYNCYPVYRQRGLAQSVYAPNGYVDATKDITTGDLPSTVTVLEEAGQFSSLGTCMDYGAPQLLPFGDEGRAMLQIVHDVAPGATLAFHTAVEGEADFANGIAALRTTAGAKVMADDIGYFDEPFFQDSLVGQAIDAAAAQGVVYFSAAGNDGQLAYDNTSPLFNAGSGPGGELLLNFDPTNTTMTGSLPVTIVPADASTGFAGGLAPGEFVAVVLEWDQPFVTGAPGSPGATSQLDLCVNPGPGGDTITDLNFNPTTCTGANTLGLDPIQILIIGNPASATTDTAPETVNITVGLISGPMPGRIKVAVLDNGGGSTINSFYSPSPTLQGHPGAAGGAAVGAAFYYQTPACGTSPAVLESYSSQGGSPILFDTHGAPAAAPPRQKPDFVGPDGVNNTFLGFIINATGSGPVQCHNNPALPTFAGTSAATPHAAAVAALLLQANPALTPAQVLQALRDSALPMASPAPDYLTGYGFIQANAALALLPPGPPAISVSPTTVTAGSSATLTWNAINVDGCTGSGGWSGTQVVSGSQTVTPSAAGSVTYTLTCNNVHGSAKSAATLTVRSAPAGGGSSGGGGGGGGLDGLTLAALLGALAARRRARLQTTG